MKLQNKRNKSALFIVSVLFLMLILIQGCKKEEFDTTPPGVVSNVTFEALNGGAIITYQLPPDDDVLYVRAEYTNSLGNDVFKASSRFANSIELDGFNDTSTHTVKLYTIDQSNNRSAAVELQITPLESFIYLKRDP